MQSISEADVRWGHSLPMRPPPISHQVRNSLKADEGTERQNGYTFSRTISCHSARAARASRRLLESDLGETSELARMQALPILGLELFQRPQPDLEVLADALAIEFAGHAGEL
jgi:hypothetical protein